MNYLTDFRFWVLTIFVGILAYWLFTKIFKSDHPAEPPTGDEKKPKKGHGDGHGHDDHHGNAVVGFLVGILKLWYVAIPGVIFLWCVFIPWSCEKQQQYRRGAAGIAPTPEYMAWKYTFNHATGYTVMRAVSIGDSSWEFEGFFHKGFAIKLKVGEIGEIVNSETSPPTRGWIKLTAIPHKNSEKFIFNGIYVDEVDWSTTAPPPEEEWSRFSLIGEKL